jgi:hypothetical protein
MGKSPLKKRRKRKRESLLGNKLRAFAEFSGQVGGVCMATAFDKKKMSYRYLTASFVTWLIYHDHTIEFWKI